MWSDESIFELFGTRVSKVRRPRGQYYDRKFVLPTIKHLSSVMTWGCFYARDQDDFIFLRQNRQLNTQGYIDILTNKLRNFITIHQCKIFQQDSAPR